MVGSGKDRRIDYIEFNVSDIGRARHFYGEAFGWTFTDYGPSYCEFSDGGLKGGFTTGAKVASGGPLVILYADDLADTLKRVEKAGGTIVKPFLLFLAAGAFISPTQMDMSLRYGRINDGVRGRQQSNRPRTVRLRGRPSVHSPTRQAGRADWLLPR